MRFEFRVIERDGDPWFFAREVVDILVRPGAKVTDYTKYLDDDETDVIAGQMVGISNPHVRDQGVTIINEPGLYSLILRSRKSRSREFKRWVTHEVLPARSRPGLPCEALRGLPRGNTLAS